MARPITLSPDAAYATKPNVQYPGTSAQASAAQTAAKARIENAIPGFTVTIAAGTIVPET